MGPDEDASEWKQRAIFDHLLEGAVIETTDGKKLMLRAKDLALEASNLRNILRAKTPDHPAFEEELTKFANAPKRVVIPLLAFLCYGDTLDSSLGNGGIRTLSNTLDILVHSQATGISGVVKTVEREIIELCAEMKLSCVQIQKMFETGVLTNILIDYASKLSVKKARVRPTDRDAALEQVHHALVKVDGFAAVIGAFLDLEGNRETYAELQELVESAVETSDETGDHANDAESTMQSGVTTKGSDNVTTACVISVFYTNSTVPFKVARCKRSGTSKRKASADARFEDMSSFADFENASGNAQATDAKPRVPSTNSNQGKNSSTMTAAGTTKKPTTRGVAKVIKKSK